MPHFSLKPFEQTPLTANLVIQGNAIRHKTSLNLEYWVTGDWEKIVLPEDRQSPTPSRRNHLWEQTCFEFFLAQGKEHHSQAPYWEFNLSPTGDWNVFALSGYRQGLQEEGAIAHLPFKVSTSPTELHLAIEVDIEPLILPDQPIQLGVSMVVLIKTEGTVAETFWAIAHPGPEADFHHPGSLSLQI